MATTSVAKIRLVRCPNCLRLLPEVADVPMYQCGGCGTILRAKNHIVSNQNVSSTSGSTSPEKKIIHSSSESRAEQSTRQNLAASASSNAENYCSERQGPSGVAEIGESSNAGANDIKVTEPYNSGASDISSDAKGSSKMKSEESFKEEAAKPPKLKEKSYDSSKKHDRLRTSAESCSQSVDSEERPDQSHEATGSTNLRSSAASSSDDGTENALRDKLKGSHVDLSQSAESNNLRSSTVSSSDDVSENGIRDKYRTLSRRTVRDRSFSGSFGTKAKEGAELLRNNTKDTEGGMSLESEAFYSIRSWVESEDGPSRSLSRRSTFFEDSTKNQTGSTSKFKNLELLKVMGELRDQLGRSYELKKKKKKKQRSQFNSAEDMLFNDYPSTYRRPQQHQSSQMPLSYLHCHLDLNLCCNNRLCTACSHNFCCHSVNTRHPIQRTNFSFPCSRNKARTTKSYCRPVSGGAPFVICQKCFEVLHMPADFLISSQLNKLKCGACSEVMALSFPALAHEVPQTSKEAGNATEGPVSFSEEYGVSFAYTSSSGTEPVINVSKASSEMGDEEKTSAGTLHQLMGYPSARVLLFENSNSLNRQSASKAL